MRPLRIRVEGFSAYRAAAEVDLEGVDLFSLSGPTGAGKSSLIDAMIFSLYGRIPRLGGRAVAPVISVGSDRARVALDFEADQTRYTVSRVAERTKNGATVREARLERGEGEAVASGAEEVTGAVEDLLGLRFDDFTKTVALPQGQFARFLHAGSAERRELLRDLLGLEVYAKVRELATMRRSVAAERASSARNQLDGLTVPDENAAQQATRRLGVIEELFGVIGDRQAALDEASQALERSRLEAAHVEAALERLAAIAPPDHLEHLDRLASEAAEAEAEALEAVGEITGEIAGLEEQLAALPSADLIASRRDAHARLAAVVGRISELDLAPWEAGVVEAEGSVAKARRALEEVRERVGRARTTHAAHTLAETLVVGDPCPVCRQEVAELPERHAPVELALLEDEERARQEDVEAARSALDAARTKLTESETRRAELEKQREELRSELATGPTLDELRESEDLLAELTSRLEQARRELVAREASLGKARKEHENLAEAIRSVGRTVVKALQSVADLDPPLSESEDPIVQWKELLAWREQETHRQADKAKKAAVDANLLSIQVEEKRAALVGELEAAGVPAVEPFAAQVARELELARQTVESHRKAVTRKRELEDEVARSEREEQVASALAGHLRADGFERWLMSGAIAGLVAGANQLLTQLSSGGYSLRSDDDGAFSIVDHANADEVRPVSTLSGGETFLVSLSLALSLAETLSASGGARLDAIILDEGFGTLDDDSLDTVATVLEELAGSGLMVGVITHVKELAARAPIRFEVSRDPSGSKVVTVP